MTNKEIANAWFAAIDAKDFDTVKSLTGHNHSFENPMTPAPVGGDQHVEMIQMLTSALEGQHRLDLVLSDGDYVTVRGRWKGRHVGEFNGIPASNKPVEFTFIDIFHVSDGKVQEEYFEMNPMSIMMQIGAVPEHA